MILTCTRHAAIGLFVFGVGLLAASTRVIAQTGVERTILLQQDVTVPGYQNVLIAVTVAAGGREGRHTHPGTLLLHMLEGELTLEHEGRPTRTYKAGESVFIEAGKIHEAMNKGTVPVRGIASLVVEKGKPLTTQVK